MMRITDFKWQSVMEPYSFYRIEYIIDDIIYHKMFLSKHRLDDNLPVPEQIAKKLNAILDCKPVELDFMKNYGKNKSK